MKHFDHQTIVMPFSLVLHFLEHYGQGGVKPRRLVIINHYFLGCTLKYLQSKLYFSPEIQAAVPYRRMCEWRYEPCATPCFKTCSDPEAQACKFLPP